MVLQTAVMTAEEKHQNFLAKDKKLITSSLGFLKASLGIRPGELSVIVGKMGQGKSALSKTLGVEAAINSVKTYYLLSEEKCSIYKSTHHKSIQMGCGEKPEKYMNNLYFESMLDWDAEKMNVESFLERVEEVINDYRTDLVVIDNVSTSFLGDLSPSAQGELARNLRKLAGVYEVAIVCVIHTKKGANPNKELLTGEDVRGSASWTNGASYVYILATYFNFSPPIALLYIDKARYHADANKTFWRLHYDIDMGIYIKDVKTTYSDALKIISDTKKGERNA